MVSVCVCLCVLFYFVNKFKKLTQGLHLDEKTRDKIKELRKTLSDLQLEFGKNVNEENKKYLFHKDELSMHHHHNIFYSHFLN